jgi:hypothetical protein
LPIREDLVPGFIADFKLIGMSVRSVKRWGKERFVIDTGKNQEWAQLVWSILGGDRCLVEEDKFGFESAYRTWYPARYVHRLRSDQVRKIIFAIFALITLAPGFAALVFHFNPFIGSQRVLADVALFSLLTVLLFFVYRWLRWQGLDVQSLPYRFFLGLVPGIVWTAATGVPTDLELIGAYWVFAVSNLLWLGTLGFDRSLQEDLLERVGGRLPWRQAMNCLTEAKRLADGPLRRSDSPCA